MKFIIHFLAFSIFFTSQAHADLKIKIQYEPLPNFLHQLDCVSKTFHSCSHETYLVLWNQFHLKSQADKEALSDWGKIRTRYNRGIELKGTGENAESEFIQLDSKIRIAGYQARDLGSYHEKLELLVSSSDALRLLSIAKHFYPSFLRWWEINGKSQGLSFSKKMKPIVEGNRILGSLKKYQDFYQAESTENEPILFNLFYRPKNEAEASNGQQLDRYSFTEFYTGETPEERVDVVVHELCHYIFDSASQDNKSKLRSLFLQLNDTSALSAFNLLNEGLATAFGNGMINRLYRSPEKWLSFMAKPKSLYNNDDIDLTAKTILPLLDEWLEKKKSLYDPDFANRYLSVLKPVFNGRLAAPSRQLKELVLVIDGELKKEFRNSLKPILQAASMWTSEGSLDHPNAFESYREMPAVNALVIVHAKNLDQLVTLKIITKENLALLKSQNKGKNQSTVRFFRSPSVSTFLVVTNSPESALEEVKNLVSSTANMEALW